MDNTFDEPPFTVTAHRFLSADPQENEASWQSFIVETADGDTLVEAVTRFPFCPKGSGEDDRCDDPTWEAPKVLSQRPLTIGRDICACQLWATETMDDLVKAVTEQPFWADMAEIGWTPEELDRCANSNVQRERASRR